jgi:4-amino-4-deoxy-L-arabinose transferase-like glycosyltransferase
MDQIPLEKPSNPSSANGSAPDFRDWFFLVLVLALAAGLRLWKLDQNGYGNPYYAAAVRSMLMNWHNFLFASFDPMGYVSVDKPPVALWIQTLSAKLFGFSGFSLIFPQVVEGCLSVALVYFLVRRRFDFSSALLAGLAMAIGPVCVAVDRYNNVDSCLVLVLLLAAWAEILAVERGSRGYLMLALGLVGLGFNVKMMAAFVALPAFYLLYFFTAPVSWGKRFADLTAASVVLLCAALSWPLYVDLTPPEQRPYVGSTQDNSMIGLSLGWNGFNRLLSRRRGFQRNPGQGQAAPSATENSQTLPNSSVQPQAAGNYLPAAAGGRRSGQLRGAGRGMGMGTGNPGPLRLVDRNMAGQFAWLIPLALLGGWAAWREKSSSRYWTPERQALFLWAGWLLAYTLVFSFMRGAMHTYYLVMLAPPAAALAGIGAAALWRKFKIGGRGRFFLPAAFFLTALWQAYLVAGYPDLKNQLMPLLFAGSGISLFILGGFSKWPALEPARHHWSVFALFVGLGSLLFCPFVWALTPVLGSGQSVEASPDLLTGRGGRGIAQLAASSPTAAERLMEFLKANHGSEKYLLAAQSSQPVAPLIISTGEPIVAIGGFMGADPTVTVNEFARMAEQGQFRYMLIAGQAPGGLNGRNGTGREKGQGPRAFPGAGGNFGNRGGFQFEIAKWVRQHGRLVDPKLWRPDGQPGVMDPTQIARGTAPAFGGRGGRGGLGFLQLYDLKATGAGAESSGEAGVE